MKASLFYLTAVFALAVQILPASSDAAPTDPMDMTGLYGFDWLHSGTHQCDSISEKTAASFKTCWYFPPKFGSSFSGSSDFYSCAVSEESEYMIYKTKERCDRELEVMRSGAP